MEPPVLLVIEIFTLMISETILSTIDVPAPVEEDDVLLFEDPWRLDLSYWTTETTATLEED